MTTRTLVCEICREAIATFDQDLLTIPLNLRIFKSLYPDRMVADPFPPALDDWRVAVCPRCRKRPFLNFYEKSEGQFIVSTGEVVPDGGQWFVLALEENGSGQFEKVLLSPIKDIEPAKELPPQEPQPTLSEIVEKGRIKPGDYDQEIAKMVKGFAKDLPPTADEDQEPETTTGNYKSPPVTCPGCGKQFRSSGRMAKYHKDCPANTPPPREGFKI